jgi:single-strand DNA-binding protein
MATFNQCQFIGRLGKDPELQVTAGKGKPVTKFSHAVDQGKNEKPLWLNVTCWDKLAETVEKYAKKGMQVFVQGRLKISLYTDKQSVERQSVEIIATVVQLLEKITTTDEPAEA